MAVDAVLLTSPGHQQPWYWLYRICGSLSYLRKCFKYLCHINVEEWCKMWIYVYICIYIFMFILENWTHKGLLITFCFGYIFRRFQAGIVQMEAKLGQCYIFLKIMPETMPLVFVRVTLTVLFHRIGWVNRLLELWVCIYGHGNGQHWASGQITGVHVYPWPTCGSQTIHTSYTIVWLIRLDIWSDLQGCINRTWRRKSISLYLTLALSTDLRACSQHTS